MPSSIADFASVSEEPGAPAAMEMVRQLSHHHRVVVRSAEAVVAASEEHDDVGSADLATQRIRAHEKAAWMLESILA